MKYRVHLTSGDQVYTSKDEAFRQAQNIATASQQPVRVTPEVKRPKYTLSQNRYSDWHRGGRQRWADLLKDGVKVGRITGNEASSYLGGGIDYFVTDTVPAPTNDPVVLALARDRKGRMRYFANRKEIMEAIAEITQEVTQ